MPFTGAHPAAVLPLLRRGRWVSAGLLTGSVAPDLPSYVPLGLRHEQTHPLHAFLWPDGVLAVGLLLAWWFLLRPGLAPLWPAAAARCGRPGWREPANWRSRSSAAAWLGWVAASLLVGLATHLLWDAVTHIDGQFVLWWPTLADRVAGHPAYDWLQGVSSVLGLAAVLGYAAWQWRVHPRGEPGGPAITPVLRAVVLSITTVAVLVTAAVEWHWRTERQGSHLLLWSAVIKDAGGTLLLCLGVWSLIWAGLRSRSHTHSSTTAGVP